MIPYPTMPMFIHHYRKGDKGDRGDRGDRGERGSVGVRGQTGEKGERGENGQQGNRGLQGIPGQLQHNISHYLIKIISDTNDYIISWAQTMITHPAYVVDDFTINKLEDIEYLIHIQTTSNIYHVSMVVDGPGQTPLVETKYPMFTSDLHVTLPDPIGTRIYISIMWES